MGPNVQLLLFEEVKKLLVLFLGYYRKFFSSLSKQHWRRCFYPWNGEYVSAEVRVYGQPLEIKSLSFAMFFVLITAWNGTELIIAQTQICNVHEPE